MRLDYTLVTLLGPCGPASRDRRVCSDGYNDLFSFLGTTLRDCGV